VHACSVIERTTHQKIVIARRIVAQLRQSLRTDLCAAGLMGSLARGTAETYSDIDLLIIVKRLHPGIGDCRIVDDTYCSISQQTFSGALSELSKPKDELPGIIGGYGKILAIFDPRQLLPKLAYKAASARSDIFRKSAQMALLHSYEDFCRVKNAHLKGDEIVLRDNILQVTHSAALIVASLNCAAFASDREIFKAHKRFTKLPARFDRIERIRYGDLKGRTLYRVFLDFYLDLVRFCKREGLDFPVHENTLRQLGRNSS
jgi:hypothetical protein